MNYENLAVRCISHYCKTKGLPRKKFLGVDYVDAVISGLIRADLKFDPTKGASKKTYLYRGAVLGLLNMKRRKGQIYTVPLNSKGTYQKIIDMAKNKFPIDLQKETLDKLMAETPFEGKQKQMLELQLEGKTKSDIAEINKCTHQNVCNTLERAILNMKKYAVSKGMDW